MTPTERILSLYDTGPATLRREGERWYHDAAAWCTTNEVHPGTVAALSPQTDWNTNKDRAYRLTHHGERIGIGLFVSRAVAIIEGAPALDVLGGSKVRSFYRNIADPHDPEAVTIDRHAYKIAHPRKPIKHLERKGEYERISDLYRTAGEARDITGSAMQAAAWSIHRGTAA